MTTASFVTPAQRLRDQIRGRSDADIVRTFSARGGLDAALDAPAPRARSSSTTS
jgi:hypothetical protein